MRLKCTHRESCRRPQGDGWAAEGGLEKACLLGRGPFAPALAEGRLAGVTVGEMLSQLPASEKLSIFVVALRSSVEISRDLWPARTRGTMPRHGKWCDRRSNAILVQNVALIRWRSEQLIVLLVGCLPVQILVLPCFLLCRFCCRAFMMVGPQHHPFLHTGQN